MPAFSGRLAADEQLLLRYGQQFSNNMISDVYVFGIFWFLYIYIVNE